MQSVLGIKDAPFLHKTALTAIVTCLEILRRGIWNFFRYLIELIGNDYYYLAGFKIQDLMF